MEKQTEFSSSIGLVKATSLLVVSRLPLTSNHCPQSFCLGGRLGAEEPAEGVRGAVLPGRPRLQEGGGPVPGLDRDFHRNGALLVQDVHLLHRADEPHHAQASRPEGEGERCIGLM